MKRLTKFWLAAVSVAALASIIVLMNTGRVAAAPQAPGTVVVYNETITLPINGDVLSNVINVSGFKQIRVLVTDYYSGHDASPYTYLWHTDIGGNILGGLDEFPTNTNKAYDTPGQNIRLELTSVGGGGVRIMVFGQPY